MSAEIAARIAELNEELDRYRPIIAALGIYGESVNLAAIVAKVRTFPEFKMRGVNDLIGKPDA